MSSLSVNNKSCLGDLSLLERQRALSACYVSQTSSIRREVLDVIPQTSLVGCQNECDGDSKCEATILNAASTHCILLGGQVLDASTNSCPAPFTAHVKTACEATTPTPQTTAVSTGMGPIDDYFTVGECSRESDIVGTPTEGATPPCGTPPLSQRRIVIDAIKADGSHMVLENNLYSSIKWDTSKKSWYFEIEADAGINTVYFYTAKCVLPPVTALLPKCECAALNTEPAYSGNYNPVPVKIDTDPCYTNYLQMNCVRAYSTAKTRAATDSSRLRTGSSHYNSYLIRAAACVD
ncbi:hypothetical protein PRIPAC_97409 [Pristionchus pacificus]|uniref:Uncharacterized protein n=1 Tax=Pristionchus pacificus TaxID=54126 RepID=A0A2A6B2V3_PRIPA|nr:hypothetical protein PRIPAC_97409 [Pristionchus pacificus]|eukprot:PDM60204.1 hypothetical protein PRIPAC_54029 [Pristionchus pacificus]